MKNNQDGITPKYPLEKILPSSPTEYCVSVGKKLSDYELRAVSSGRGDLTISREDSFRYRVPDEAEIVVDYRMIGDKLVGIALIPIKR